jgi:hypothetical protein
MNGSNFGKSNNDNANRHTHFLRRARFRHDAKNKTTNDATTNHQDGKTLHDTVNTLLGDEAAHENAIKDNRQTFLSYT